MDSPSPEGGKAGLNVESAWSEAAASGGNDVVVAVVDEGVDYRHPDLVNKMWDGRSHRYEHHGWDSSQDKASDAYFDPMDRNGHGTHVAGIIAAQANNGEGVAGVAGAAQNVKILAAKVFGDSDGFSSAIVDSYDNLLKLKQSGVNIVATNNSWKTTILSKTAAEAMEALGEAGVVNVMAAGNDHSDNDVTMGFPYNIRSKHSIVVAASTPWDEIVEFSNYGRRSVHIAAPGAWILSTYSKHAEPQHGEDAKLISSFVKELTAGDKILYYQDFKSMPAYSVISGDGRQSLSNESGYLEWRLTANSAGTFAIRLDGAAIDLASVREMSQEEDGDGVYLWTASMSDKNFTVSLCAGTGEEGADIYDTTVQSNNNYDGNTWKAGIPRIKDPYDKWLEEWEIEQPDGWRAWRSEAAYPVLSIELDAGESRVIKIKNIAVLKGKPYDDEKPYRYMDGTSMASPAAAGSLALLAAIRPELSPDELRARIIGGTVKIPSMKDKILTGGRLSVEKALNNPSPVVNSASLEGGTLTVEGFFFGGEGTLSIITGGAERKLDAASWSENKITAKLPEAPSGECEIVVTRADGDWGRLVVLSLKEAESQWATLASPPFGAVRDAALAADAEGGIIYMTGCFREESMSPRFAAYNIAEDEWRELTPLPDAFVSSEDENGNTIDSSLGVAMTVFDGAPTVIRNYDGKAVLVARYENGSWNVTSITEFGGYWDKPQYYEKVFFAAPAKDGASILMLTDKGMLWRITPDEGKMEKLDAPELFSASSLDGAMASTEGGTVAVFGGNKRDANVPVFFDGETSWTGAPCPAPEEGEFSWTGAAFGWYGGFLVALEGTNNAAASIGDGAYYDLDADEWRAEPTGRASIRNCGASVVVGDYIYRAAITDFFNGVTNEFERLSLKADAPEPLPDDPAQGGGSGGGCSSGFAALALLAAVPLIFARKRK
ncbi:S8 family serine peptidase [uncultured Cloacibacillus sp.]|uniref:S8 family serine peptidase n=1 Tax=uncultured Cloacibacillus sp. TaxID=889794 RepID=UPI002638A35E|nr:S8 family serine peptidase [uncultured Cloacibacillus sp.]